MSISGHHTAEGPADLLAEVVARVAELDDLLWSARSDEEIVGTAELVQRAKAVLAAVESDAVSEAEARQVAEKALHHASTADWLTHAGGLRRWEGHRLVRRAVALTGPLERTRARLVAGVVSAEQADVIVRTIADLPAAARLRQKAEKVLLGHARSLDAAELGKAARHLVTVIDPDGTDRRLEAQLDRDERAAHADRYLSIVDDGAGWVRLKGRGSVEDGAVLKPPCSR